MYIFEGGLKNMIPKIWVSEIAAIDLLINDHMMACCPINWPMHQDLTKVASWYNASASVLMETSR